MPNHSNIVKRFGPCRRSQRHGNATPGAPGSSLLWPTIFMPLACLIMLGLQGWIEWEARTAQARETETSLANLASSLTQHAADTIEAVDTALVGLVERLETDGTSPEALAHLDRKLAAQAAEGTRCRNVVILGADGNWLASSMGRKGGNYSDREYLRHHLDNPAPGLFVGPPIQSHSGGGLDHHRLPPLQVCRRSADTGLPDNFRPISCLFRIRLNAAIRDGGQTPPCSQVNSINCSCS
jgi:hypothetical protein